MAGGHHKILHEDPALQKWATLNFNRFRYFRWTNRTAKYTFLYVAVIPSIVTYFAIKTDGKYELRGKRRGDDIREF
ncbi:hypothetical protein BZA77DRAFT_319853 [Pyronema omphalodes]|nr:hypothetical protein BZA77DRAFT_319853 [Pyronema omphalodes]